MAVNTVTNVVVGTLGGLYSKAICMSVLNTHNLVISPSMPCDVNVLVSA